MKTLRTHLTTILISCLFLPAVAQQIAFERDSNTTATYEEVIAHYRALDEAFETCKLLTYGPTDSGKPLNLLVISKDQLFDPEQVHELNKPVILINNGIHPGEPEGIDAAMMLLRDMLTSNDLPENAVLCVIPVYNIGGMLNRGVSRVNQNGPDAYGFRGNARNYDLNRDFIKSDSRNSRSFQEIFNTWQPDVFMDTHTSNGADYQYIMTLIDTQIDKLHPALRETASAFTAGLYNRMEDSGYDMVPYVNFRGRTPESGLVSFYESPRYSTGYAALHHTFGYMPETHMWKPYPQRVRSTYTLLSHFIQQADERAPELHKQRMLARQQSAEQQQFVLTWQVDTTQYDHITFKGFESGEKPSDVSGFPRLYYDRNKPYSREIRYYNRYQPGIVVDKPYAYIIPQGWQEVVELLTLNGVTVEQLENDTTLTVQLYYMDGFETARNPYEGHYLHSGVEVRPETQTLSFSKGDYIVVTNQPENRFIVETLEPQSVDSYFNWNFFDSILGQKEHFSAYIFEDEAFRMLNEDPALKERLEEAKATDEQLRNSGQAQLNWIYKQSPYYEKTHLRYPIGRLLEAL